MSEKWRESANLSVYGHILAYKTGPNRARASKVKISTIDDVVPPSGGRLAVFFHFLKLLPHLSCLVPIIPANGPKLPSSDNLNPLDHAILALRTHMTSLL